MSSFSQNVQKPTQNENKQTLNYTYFFNPFHDVISEQLNNNLTNNKLKFHKKHQILYNREFYIEVENAPISIKKITYFTVSVVFVH